MVYKLIEKIKNIHEKLAEPGFARVYLVTLLMFINLALYFYSYIQSDEFILGVCWGLTIFITLFLAANTKKKREKILLDQGIMIDPFKGLTVMELISSPTNIVAKDREFEPAPISLITWLYFCVKAIAKSDKEQFHYHQHLVDAINEHYPPLLSWLPDMYNIHKLKPPLPKDITLEDFGL